MVHTKKPQANMGQARAISWFVVPTQKINTLANQHITVSADASTLRNQHITIVINNTSLQIPGPVKMTVPVLVSASCGRAVQRQVSACASTTASDSQSVILRA
jgi:hypothetical protein